MMASATKPACIAALLCAFSGAAHAEEVSEAAARLESCVADRNEAACRRNLTQASHEIYDRFTGYKLMDCLPQSAAFVSSQALGRNMLVKENVSVDGTVSQVSLVFKNENNSWKLDIPATLRRALGEYWENSVDGTEQVFKMVKSQMGDNLDCVVIRRLAANSVPPRPAAKTRKEK